MKTLFAISAAAVLLVQQVVAHATFQDLWVNGVDEQGYCVRLPPSNSPVTDVTSTNLRCNVNGATGVSGKCVVAAGSTVTVEMHQQQGDRDCTTQAIGGNHYGPVLVYMSKVADSSTADGSSGWFKVFQDTWAKDPTGSSGSDDSWGTKDLNTCCGKMSVKIPADIPAGDYLLRSEAIALHAAASVGGAQFYMSCYQLTVTGGGSASPALVQFPGAYKATDPGIEIDIYESLSTYVAPGPTVYSGGTTKSSGATCTGAELGTTTGPSYVGSTAKATSTPTSKGVTTTLATTTKSGGTTPTTTPIATTTTGGGGGSSCTAAAYAQCGGTGWTGCTVCGSGLTCSAVSPPYYSQCLTG